MVLLQKTFFRTRNISTRVRFDFGSIRERERKREKEKERKRGEFYMVAIRVHTQIETQSFHQRTGGGWVVGGERGSRAAAAKRKGCTEGAEAHRRISQSLP